jgi:esterase/lipase
MNTQQANIKQIGRQQNMGTIDDMIRWVKNLIGSTFDNPDDEISDILSDFNSINERLIAAQAKHDKADKEALAEIASIEAETKQKIAALDARHNALITAQERAAKVSQKINEFVS